MIILADLFFHVASTKIINMDSSSNLAVVKKTCCPYEKQVIHGVLDALDDEAVYRLHNSLLVIIDG
jgi:hypothetical protein